MRYFFRDKHQLRQSWIHYIHPNKQQLAHQLTTTAPSWVDYIIIFGSAVTANCRPDSDLDICVIGAYPLDLSGLWPCLDSEEKDIIFKQSIDDFKSALAIQPAGVMHEIKTKGVVIYDRKKEFASAS